MSTSTLWTLWIALIHLVLNGQGDLFRKKVGRHSLLTGEVTHCEALLNFELDICLCRSQAKKDGAEDDVAKYDGAWAVEPLAKVTRKSQYDNMSGHRSLLGFRPVNKGTMSY